MTVIHKNFGKGLYMSEKSDSGFVGNIIVLIIIIALFAGMVKIGGGLSEEKFKQKQDNEKLETLISKLQQYKKVDNVKTVETYSDNNNVVLKDFDDTQKDKAHQDETISFSTAINYFKTRELSQTEKIVLEENANFGKYFVRRSQNKLVLYNSADKKFVSKLQAKMKNYSSNKDVKFLSNSSAFSVRSEAAAKTSNDRVLYQLYKDCVSICIMDVPNSKLYILKAPNVNEKSASILDIVLKNL